jgi:hypothetical protein
MDRGTIRQIFIGAGWFITLLGARFDAAAQIQPVESLSPARSLSCLVTPKEALRYPAQDKFDRQSGLVRVQLHFENADTPPRVQILANTAREDMSSMVQDYVRKYRLPCLGGSDGTIIAVQDFTFSNTEQQPLPVSGTEGPKPDFCVIAPTDPVPTPAMGSDESEHVILEFNFDGDGQSPPKISTAFSTGWERLERVVRNWASQYRMPCRHAGDPPFTAKQKFSFIPASGRSHQWKTEVFSLPEFLRMTRDPASLTADFDLNTMDCPFLVNYTTNNPHLPNVAQSSFPENPNRIGFLKWLAELQLNFANKRQANDLFGSTLQIQVPCGQLQLAPKKSPK